MSQEPSHKEIHGAIIFLEQGRYQEAEKMLTQFLSVHPDHGYALNLLASCQYHLPHQRERALQTINQALMHEPDNPTHYELKALICCDMNLKDQAAAMIAEALKYDPSSGQAHAVSAYICLSKEDWTGCEKAARQALACDGNQLFAGNLLATALRMQNRLDENVALVDDLLSKDPHDAMSHTNAGWVHLARNDLQRAQVHFREALRLDPNFEPARMGMLDSLKARSWFYRWYLQYNMFMARQTNARRWLIVLGVIFSVRGVRHLSQQFAGGRFEIFGVILVGLFLIFFFWTWLAGAIGHLIILNDSFARYALKKDEILEGVFAGGGFLLGLLSLLVGFLTGHMIWNLIGATALMTTIPLTLTFTNQHPKGRWLYGSAALLIMSCGIFAGFFLPTTSDDVSNHFFIPLLMALVILASCTWLANFRVYRQ